MQNHGVIIQSPQINYGKKIPLYISIRGGVWTCKTPTNQKQWAMRDSNPHSRDYESPALTIKLIALTFLIDFVHTPRTNFSNNQLGILFQEECDGIRTVRRNITLFLEIPESPHSGFLFLGLKPPRTIYYIINFNV